MINIECSECRCDLNTGDSIFCEQCYSQREAELEEKIEALEEENRKLQNEIDNLYKEEK